MSDKKNIIIVCVLVVIVAVMVVVFKSFSILSVNTDGMTFDSAPAVDFSQLDLDYRSALSVIMPRYQAALQTGDKNMAAVARDDLLALTMPPQYRSIHAQLVLLLDSFLDGASSVEESRSALAALAQSSEWLRNYISDVQ